MIGCLPPWLAHWESIPDPTSAEVLTSPHGVQGANGKAGPQLARRADGGMLMLPALLVSQLLAIYLGVR